MNTKMLQGRRALVTGSAQGIGLAVAKRWPRRAVRWCCRAGQPGRYRGHRRARAAGAPSVQFFGHDLADAAQVEQRCWRQRRGRRPRHRGQQRRHPAHRRSSMPRARWDAILAINLSAAFDTMRLALPGMAERGYGRVVNIASVHGLVASVHKAPTWRRSSGWWA